MFRWHTFLRNHHHHQRRRPTWTALTSRLHSIPLAIMADDDLDSMTYAELQKLRKQLGIRMKFDDPKNTDDIKTLIRNHRAENSTNTATGNGSQNTRTNSEGGADNNGAEPGLVPFNCENCGVDLRPGHRFQEVCQAQSLCQRTLLIGTF